jgi:hypothetical protein
VSNALINGGRTSYLLLFLFLFLFLSLCSHGSVGAKGALRTNEKERKEKE